MSRDQLMQAAREIMASRGVDFYSAMQLLGRRGGQASARARARRTAQDQRKRFAIAQEQARMERMGIE